MGAKILENWKSILGSVAGILVVALQIINVFISSDIDHTLGTKAVLMENKAATLEEKSAALNALVEQKAALMDRRADDLRKQISELEAHQGHASQ